MMPGRIDAADGKNALTVKEGVLESFWHPGSIVDVDDAKDAMRAVDRVTAAATRRHTNYPHEFFTSREAALAWLADVSQAADKGGTRVHPTSSDS